MGRGEHNLVEERGDESWGATNRAPSECCGRRQEAAAARKGIMVASVRQFPRRYRDYRMKVKISKRNGGERVPATKRELVVPHFQKLIGVKCFPGRDMSDD